jgi:hypothetical protein
MRVPQAAVVNKSELANFVRQPNEALARKGGYAEKIDHSHVLFE